MISKVILLAFLAVAANANPLDLDTTTVNYRQAMDKFLEAWKNMLPCGYAADNIPVLAPLTNDFSAFNYTLRDTSIKGNVSNIRISGLNHFEILAGSFDANTQHATFDVLFPEIQITGSYALEGIIDIYGILLPTHQASLINERFQQLRLVGDYTFAPSLINSSGLRISEYHLQFYLGDVKIDNWDTLWDISSNNLSNRFASDVLSFVAQHIQPDVDKLLGKYVIPSMNDMLSAYSLSQLSNLLVSTANDWNSANCQVKA